MELFDAIAERGPELVLGGLMLLGAAFLLSFFLKTCWGQWKDRAREGEIYGKPRKRHQRKRGL